MYTHVDCIALRTTRISDSKSLLSVWASGHGRLTFAIPAGATREARRRRALTTPLALFGGECDIRPDREILSVRDVQPLPGSMALSTDPLRQLVAMFLAEVLDLILRRCEPENNINGYLFSTAEELSQAPEGELDTFHIHFLYQLTYFLGIGPQLDDYTPGAVFDMREGRFRATAPLHADVLIGRECTVLRSLARGSGLPRSKSVLRKTLDAILRYYTIHLMSFDSLKSLDILRNLD